MPGKVNTRLPWVAGPLIVAWIFASTPARCEERATLLLESEAHPSGSHLAAPDSRVFLHGAASWSVLQPGARVVAEIAIPGHLTGSIEFLAGKTLSPPSRALVVRLDLQDPADDPIAEVAAASVNALEGGPRLAGVVSRRDDKTFDIRLEPAEAEADAKAVGFARTIDVAFRLRSGRIGRMSIDRGELGAKALASLFPALPNGDTRSAIYEGDLSSARAESDAARMLFGAAPSGVACFARVYDAAHLLAHPRQLVTALSVSVERAPWSDKQQPDADDPTSTAASWTFTASATLRNGVAAGAIKGALRQMNRRLLNDALHERLVLSAPGGVEDGPDELELIDEGRHAVFRPLDEMGFGITWPSTEDPALQRRARKAKVGEPDLAALLKPDDQAFALDRADPLVCQDIYRRAQGATHFKQRP